jgi:hypothetical protein
VTASKFLKKIDRDSPGNVEPRTSGSSPDNQLEERPLAKHLEGVQIVLSQDGVHQVSIEGSAALKMTQ